MKVLSGMRHAFATCELALVVSVAFFVSAPVLAMEQQKNVYATGADVRIETPVDGDLYAAAGKLHVAYPVRGDAVIAGGSVDLSASIGEDLRAAGGFISLSGKIGGEALLAGGSIAFGPEAVVLGRTWVAGGDIAIAGTLESGLTVYGKNILVLGHIDGPVELYGEKIEIVASARIRGDVTYSSRSEIRIDPRAQITGTVTRAKDTLEFPRPKLHLPGFPVIRPLLLLGLLAAGALLLLLFPRFTAHALSTLDTSPLKSIGLGTAIFFSLPPVILLLMLTIIGIPIALLLAALYAAALLVGYLITAFFIGDRLLHTVRRTPEASFGWRVLALLVALLLLWLAYALPYVGTFIALLALFAGLGAMVLQAFSRYAQTA